MRNAQYMHMCTQKSVCTMSCLPEWDVVHASYTTTHSSWWRMLKIVRWETITKHECAHTTMYIFTSATKQIVYIYLFSIGLYSNCCVCISYVYSIVGALVINITTAPATPIGKTHTDASRAASNVATLKVAKWRRLCSLRKSEPRTVYKNRVDM